MRFIKYTIACTVAAGLLLQTQAQPMHKIKKEIKRLIGLQTGEFAVAFEDLQTGKTLYLHEHTIFHAASTMKTAVLIEAYKQAAAGKFQLTDSVTVTNEFKSIADSSHFSLRPTDDSEQDLYGLVGKKQTIYDLLYRMIIRSSNLATNIIIEKLGATAITSSMRSLGANDILVLRGVEDDRAFEKGMNNVITAYDLALLFKQMANGVLVSPEASRAMIRILLDQQFNEIIPAKLPKEVKVAHKTGSITGVRHDAGIVFLPNGKKYVLVLLSGKLQDDKAAIACMADISAIIFRYMQGNDPGGNAGSP